VLNIRIIKKSEYEQAYHVLQVCFQKPSVTKATLPNSNAIIFVADVDGRIVGTVSLVVTSTFSYIDDLAVLPAYQHQGIATQLVQAAMKIAEQNSPLTYAVCVSQWSCRIFKHLGFTKEEYGRYTKYHKNP
jgi:ribosomal protein S18 acetylase RimI-like enzyme